MSQKAIFLDRDGTINEDYEYVYKPEDLKFIDNIENDLLRLQKAGFLLIIITNQSGIGRGFFSEEEANIFNYYLKERLEKKGISITDIFMCPHHPDLNCNCRKPSPRMIKEAMGKYNINPEQSFMIGDKPIDVESGINAGVRSFLVDKVNNFNFWTNYILNKTNDE